MVGEEKEMLGVMSLVEALQVPKNPKKILTGLLTHLPWQPALPDTSRMDPEQCLGCRSLLTKPMSEVPDRRGCGCARQAAGQEL